MRARFTLSEVQQAALLIVDRDGLSGLSMRSLASALHTGPMTLYNYVRNRDQLEELVAEAVIAGVELPEATGSWLDDVGAIAHALWHAVRAHPNAIPLVLTRRTVSASSYVAAERLVDALAGGGLTGADLLAAFRAVLALVTGSAQVELAGPLAGPDRDQAQVDAAALIGELAGEQHQQLAALASVSRQSSAAQDFTRALELLLAGIASRSAAVTGGGGERATLD